PAKILFPAQVGGWRGERERGEANEGEKGFCAKEMKAWRSRARCAYDGTSQHLGACYHTVGFAVVGGRQQKSGMFKKKFFFFFSFSILFIFYLYILAWNFEAGAGR
ncbi:hypothetical protein MUK42_33998, partial [Musa troglodytarum]